MELANQVMFFLGRHLLFVYYLLYFSLAGNVGFDLSRIGFTVRKEGTCEQVCRGSEEAG